MKVKTLSKKNPVQQVNQISYERSDVAVSYYALCHNLVVDMATQYGHEHTIGGFCAFQPNYTHILK